MGKLLRDRMIAALGTLFISLLAPPPLTGAAELTQVKYMVGLPTLSYLVANQTIPIYLGYYKEEGLDVRLSSSGGPAIVTQLVAAGHQDIGSSSQSGVLFPAADGKDMGVVFFYNQIRDFHWVIGVLPDSEVSEVNQLKGKSIGVITLASEGLFAAKYMARLAGLDPDKDITFIAVGIGAQAAHALRTGRVSAISLLPAAFAQMETLGHGFRYLPVPPEAREIFGPGLFARRDFIQRNRKAVVGIGRAVAKGTLFLLTNPEAAVRIHWRLYPEQVPKGIAEEKAIEDAVYALKAQSVGWQFRPEEKVKLWGYFPPEGWDAYLKAYGLKDKIHDSTRYYTNDLIQEMNDFDQEKVTTRAKAFSLK